MSYDIIEMDSFAVRYLKNQREASGNQLLQALSIKFPRMTEDEFVEVMQRLVNSGQVDCYDEIPNSLVHYLKLWDVSLWFYVSIALSLTAPLVAYAVPPNLPFALLRWSIGLVFALFLPGYAALRAVLPFARLHKVERFGLSVGLSLLLDMCVGLVLNYTVFGIKLIPVLLFLSTMTISLATLAVVRHVTSGGVRNRRLRTY
jgi:hypothetical protein